MAAAWIIGVDALAGLSRGRCARAAMPNSVAELSVL